MRSSIILAALILLSGCVTKGDFGTATEAAWCTALLANAPTASVHDTPQTQKEVADIGDVIDTLCKE